MHDRLSSVRMLVSQNGAVVNHYTYEPFGMNRESGGVFNNYFRFAGEWYDGETVQYNLRARQYDAFTGRFTSRDPVNGELEEPMSLHPYLYCNNDPVNRTDPSGELWGVLVRARRTVLGVSAYYSGMYMGLRAATSPWDVMDVAIASNKFRETYFDPENLNRPFAWELALQQGFSNAIDKIKNACDWSGLAGCLGKHFAWSAAETGVQIALTKTAIAYCAACFIDPEPISKTVSCGVCVGYVGWNVVSAWQTGWGAGKCFIDNCTSWK